MRLTATLLTACLALPLSALAAEPCDGLAEDLAVMNEAGQALRKRIDYLDPESRAQQKLMQHIELVDRVNTGRLKAAVARCGWPSKATHGAQAAADAWLLVEQAERDPAFQKQMLVLVEQAAGASGEGLDRSFAYLDDRIAGAEKRPQRYWTQLSARGKDRCALEFAPFDNREQVEARRAQLGLPPLETYRRMALDMQKCPGPLPAPEIRYVGPEQITRK